MDEQFSKTKCPPCEGQGTLSPSAIIEQFSNPELRKRPDTKIAEISESLAPMGDRASKGLNDEKETHNWNPAVPIWRRSPERGFVNDYSWGSRCALPQVSVVT